MAVIPGLADLCVHNDIPIMGCLAGMLVLCVYVSSLLPETLGQVPEDEVYELRKTNSVSIELTEMVYKDDSVDIYDTRS